MSLRLPSGGPLADMRANEIAATARARCRAGSVKVEGKQERLFGEARVGETFLVT
jgi:hypothetical protein